MGTIGQLARSEHALNRFNSDSYSSLSSQRSDDDRYDAVTAARTAVVI
jgi:hypothetical protein